MRDFSVQTVWDAIRMVFALIGGWLGLFLGNADRLLILLIVFVILDYLSGVLRAISEKKLSSAVGFRGISRKVLTFVMVGLAHQIDKTAIGSGSMLRSAVIFFYLSNEGLSLIENASQLGLPIPEQLRRILIQLHNRDSGGKKHE
ncbi:MAG: phage holin family protein [Candidatus Faecivicinus sp.]|nr:phage holin family protein [Candidatus Faecivicinus sp.]